jgi:hypothetical protein
MLLRFSPLLAPVMHRINVYMHFFFVPNRIVWNEWEDFITGGPDGTSAPVPPYLPMAPSTITGGYLGKGSIADYFGVPTIEPGAPPALNTQNISAMPFRAYQMIYNEFFRDQNVETPVPFALTGGNAGPDDQDLMTIRNRAWERDYFTSCLPWTQRGPAVTLPSDVVYKNPTRVYEADVWPALGPVSDAPLKTVGGDAQGGAIAEDVIFDNIESLSTTIADLRRAVRLQEWLEKNARGGARYVEQILSHFGELVPDSRLQRPEFLSSARIPVSISEVLSNFQFSGDPDGLPQGTMAGHGISVGRTGGFKKKFVEHGHVIGLISVVPRTAYQQGIPKHLQRVDKFDYFWPEFANIGEQAVLSKELYHDPEGSVAEGDQVFGYQSRYAEYKYTPSTVHGEFRDTLDFWHMGRKFGTRPMLNSAFIQADPTSRIFAVPSEPEPLYCQIFNKVDAIRPMPYFGTPRL